MILGSVILAFACGIVVGWAISYNIRNNAQQLLSEAKEYNKWSYKHLEKSDELNKDAKELNRDSKEKYLEILAVTSNKGSNKWRN